MLNFYWVSAFTYCKALSGLQLPPFWHPAATVLAALLRKLQCSVSPFFQHSVMQMFKYIESRKNLVHFKAKIWDFVDCDVCCGDLGLELLSSVDWGKIHKSNNWFYICFRVFWRIYVKINDLNLKPMLEIFFPVFIWLHYLWLYIIWLNLRLIEKSFLPSHNITNISMKVSALRTTLSVCNFNRQTCGENLRGR